MQFYKKTNGKWRLGDMSIPAGTCVELTNPTTGKITIQDFDGTVYASDMLPTQFADSTGTAYASAEAYETATSDFFVKALGDEGKTGVTFTGVVSVANVSTIYTTYTVSTNLSITLDSTKKIGGGAEVRLIGDGSHTPTFSSDFTKHPDSGDFVNTLNKVNYVVFYYNGVETLYSIKQL